jgi:uncharacterized membrane protein
VSQFHKFAWSLEMKIRTFLLVIGLLAFAALVALNWSAIMTPTTLSLGVASVQAPLGFLMLTLLTLFTALFLGFVLYSRASGLFKDRHHSQEMQTTQELADNAETSRFTELRELLGVGLKKQSDLYAESTATVLARLEQLDSDLRSAIKA